VLQALALDDFGGWKRFAFGRVDQPMRAAMKEGHNIAAL